MATTIFSSQLTQAGFVRVPLLDIKAYLDGLYTTAYGADADLSATSPDGQVSAGIAEMFDDLNAVVYDAHRGLTDPNAATGQMLSGLMALTGCPRNAGTKSTAPATFGGTPGTVIGTDKVVQSTYDDSLWSPLEAYTIGVGGSVSGTLQCNTIGPPPKGRVPAGSLTIIQTVTDGWDSVTNSVGVPGYNVEGDPNGRMRRQQSVAVASQGMADGLQAALKKIPHVLDAVVWENDTDHTLTIGQEGNTINPHSYRIFARVDLGSSADPATTSSSADPIANTIFALKGGGCGTQGSITKNPLDAVGNPHPINYDLATALSVKVYVMITKRFGWPADGARQIQNLITDWAKGINTTTGKPNIQISGNDKGALSWTDVLASFLHEVPGFDFNQLRFSSDGGSTWTTGNDSLPIPFGSFVDITDVQVVEY